MPDFTLNEIPTEETPHEEVSLKTPKKVVKKVNYEIQEVKLSKNIQAFDKRPRVYTENPYSFNAVSLKKFSKNQVKLTPSAEQMIVNPTYHEVGKFLGVDTRHDWNQLHDRVLEIVEWAKKKSGLKEPAQLVRFINGYKNRIPTLADKHIDNLYLYAHQQLKKYGT